MTRCCGRISQYAWGEDYHRLMTERLHALLDFIQREQAGTRGLFYSDTGPVMEKVWGAHSALGWMGKHSNLITREEGSWFFIGVVLLDLELEYDKPEKRLLRVMHTLHSRLSHSRDRGAVRGRRPAMHFLPYH